MYTNSSYVLRVTRFTPSRMSSPTHPHRNDIDNVHNHRGRIPFHQHHPGNAVSDPGAVAVWPPCADLTFMESRSTTCGLSCGLVAGVRCVAAPTRSRAQGIIDVLHARVQGETKHVAFRQMSECGSLIKPTNVTDACTSGPSMY